VAGPAIINVEPHRRLCEVLDNPGRRPAKQTNVRRYLLSGGLLVCGKVVGVNGGGEGDDSACGRPLYSQPSNSGQRGYVCRSGAPSYGCGRIRIAASGLEDEVRARVLARVASPRVLRRLEKAAAELNVDKLRRELAEQDGRLTEAGREYARREIAMAVLKGVQAEVDKRKKELSEALKQAERLASLPSGLPEDLADWWLSAALDQRCALISTVLDHVVVRAATRRGPIRVDLDRLEFIWR
jgi:hypothetical protein